MGLGSILDKFFSFFGSAQGRSANGNQVFALDLGSYLLKAVHGYSRNGEIVIRNIATTGAPTIMNKISYLDDITNEIDIITGKIETLLESMNAEADRLFVSLPDNFSVMRVLSHEEPHEQAKASGTLAKLLEPHLPHPANLWEVLHEKLEQSEKSSNTLVLATLRKNYALVNDFISEALAEPDYISVSSMLSYEALYPYMAAAPEKNFALINMGHVVTSASIFKGTNLRSFQTIYNGGLNFTLDIANSMQVPVSEAETYKRSELFFLPEYVPQQEKVKNYTVIKPTFMELTRGIFYLFESYFTQHFEEKIDEIILFGGGANFKNIEVTIGGMLNTNIRKASSIIKAKYEDQTPVEEDVVNQCLPLIGAIIGGSGNES